jgi:peptidoglycan-associated lipoprotein
MRTIRGLAAVALSATVLGACATKGFVRTQVSGVQTELTAEKAARASADSGLSTEITTVKNDVSTLRNDVEGLRRDLTALRTEFGAKITAMENGMKFAFPVTFAYDDATVRDEDRASLDRFVQVINKYYGGTLITVEGFADPAGAKRYNLDLSKRRAESVAGYLSQSGISGVTVRTVGYGEDRLAVDGAEKDMPGAQSNRRVVFVIETAGGASAVSQSQ